MSWGSWMKKNTASDISLYRDDLPENPIVADARKKAPFMAVLGGRYSYLAKLNGNMSNGVQFEALGFTKLVIIICRIFLTSLKNYIRR